MFAFGKIAPIVTVDPAGLPWMQTVPGAWLARPWVHFRPVAVLACNSHRARSRAEGLAPGAVAVYSWGRRAKGGYLAVTEEQARAVLSLARPIPGVTRLRPPYDDLAKCHHSDDRPFRGRI